jgi:hypothetical protein
MIIPILREKYKNCQINLNDDISPKSSFDIFIQKFSEAIKEIKSKDYFILTFNENKDDFEVTSEEINEIAEKINLDEKKKKKRKKKKKKNKKENKKEIKKNKKKSIEKTKNNLPKIINGIKSKISQQLSKKKINEKIINMSLDNYYTLPNNSFLTTQINSNKKHYINLRYSQNLNKSSPNIFQRSKSALKEKYKKNNIINNIFNNEKFSYDFEEKKNKVTPFAKYLISKYKNIVDNYEKLENDEQIQMEEIYNKKSKGKNKLNNSFNQKTLSDKFLSLNLRNSNKISNNGNNYNSNNSIPSKIVVIKKID